METWLLDKDTDESADEFGVPFRLDRDASVNGKSLVEACVFYVNEHRCESALVRVCVCVSVPSICALGIPPAIRHGVVYSSES